MVHLSSVIRSPLCCEDFKRNSTYRLIINTKMTDISTFTLIGVKICWRIDNFANVLSSRIGGNSSIESQSFLLKNDQWSVKYSYNFFTSHQITGYNFSILSAAVENQERYNFHIRIENTDGTCLFEDDAVYVNSSLYRCDINNLEYEKMKYLSEKKKNCVTFVCLAYSFSENLYSMGSKEIPISGDKRDISTQTISLKTIETLSDNLKELLTSGNHADIKIKVGSREFHAHKFLLAARSSVLNSMFSNDMLESKSGVLNITDCDEDAFGGFLMFLYSGKLEDIRSDKIAGLYEIADKYDFQELKKECMKRMTIDMSIESICDALGVTTLYEENGLMEKATNFFISNADEILNTLKWEIFLEDHPRTGNELFKKLLKCKK